MKQVIFLLLEQGLDDIMYMTFTVYILFRNEIYRFNLELGQFLAPMVSDARELNCCIVNDYHQLLLCGTNDGRVEAYDHRDRNRVGTMDCFLSSLVDYDIEGDKGYFPIFYANIYIKLL